ncbi:MAG: hypothetical protein GF311_24680 [Candidatus Lokiarchaeota archaeon]|nr:hypothetical protein [Candidatus Lokiarchaeota archaeon]
MKIRGIDISWKRIVTISMLIFFLGVGSYGIYFLYRLDKPVIIKSFQDPFIFNNGTKVQTKEDWEIRRTEIKDLLLNEEYGIMPEHPYNITAKVIKTEDLGNGHTLKTTKLIMYPNVSSTTPINFTLWVYIPNGTGPFPTIVKVSEDGTGTQEKMSDYILQRGYMYVCYNHIELDPDTKSEDIAGPCQKMYPSYSWETLAVWAWGAMRVADYLLNESWVNAPDGIPHVNSSVLIITGHSRRGKTALLAGAMDERFTMVVPNGSGCGGAGSFLVQGYLSETIADITSKFKTWFKEGFENYGGNEAALPFDQHFLRALVAPRIILNTEGLIDFWANPIGAQAVYEATEPVYDFLNATYNNSIHYRSGGHGFTQVDFKTLMDLSDRLLFGKPITGNFYMKPFNIDFPIDYSPPN